MNRRHAISMIGLSGLAASGTGLNADDEGNHESVKMEGGWQYKELEYEKHIPEVTVSREGEVAVITVQVKHPQTAEHHISTFKIYNENRIELTEFNLHPELSQPRATFYLKLPAETRLIATTDCNIHGIWMKKFQA
jgi:superoxide reductase